MATTSDRRRAPGTTAEQRRNRRSRRLIAVIAAILAPVLIWTVTVPVLGHTLQVPDQAEGTSLTVGAGAVIAVAGIACALGWGSLALLERLTRRARTAWAALATVALLLSFLLLSGPGIDLLTRFSLGCMHLAVAAILMPVLLLTSPRSAHESTTTAG
jgi:hypothetical protein